MSTDTQSEIPTTQALVTNEDVKPLIGSRFYHPLEKGIQFNLDLDGKLLTVPLTEVRGLTGSLKLFGQAHAWWAGDLGALIKDQYGDEELAHFFGEVGLEPTRGKQLISISRSYGFPDKITEYRHPDPKVSWQHHNIVQGIKDRGQRRMLLDRASAEQMSVAVFYDYVKKWKAGVDDSSSEGEADKSTDLGYGMFRAKFRAYDPKTDNPEQYLQAFVDHVRDVEFPEYLDPARRQERENREKREDLVKKLPEELGKQLLTEQADLPLDKFTALVETLAEKTKEQTKIENALKGVKDETLRVSLAERVKNENIVSFDTFKDIAKKAKDEARQRTREKDKIEKLIAKITDEEKRNEITDLVAKENLFFTQVEPMVKSILADEQVEKEALRIRKESEDKIQKRADQIRKQQLEPKEKKAAGQPDLPISKTKKKTAAKSKKSTKSEASVDA
jgi:hypothetical protein